MTKRNLQNPSRKKGRLSWRRNRNRIEDLQRSFSHRDGQGKPINNFKPLTSLGCMIGGRFREKEGAIQWSILFHYNRIHIAGRWALYFVSRSRSKKIAISSQVPLLVVRVHRPISWVINPAGRVGIINFSNN